MGPLCLSGVLRKKVNSALCLSGVLWGGVIGSRVSAGGFKGHHFKTPEKHEALLIIVLKTPEKHTVIRSSENMREQVRASETK